MAMQLKERCSYIMDMYETVYDKTRLNVEYDLFPLYWSWDHFLVEKA